VERIDETFRPLTSTVPPFARSMAAISLSSVVLPAPECPVRKSISPASTEKLTAFRASKPPG